jgi:predicted ribosomally synthesized peptide with SipW-like signal peptide
MTSSKSTKRALISSALAILMCAAMLIGTTFAWFTDTASTGVNKIVSGNLDIAVEYRTSSEGDWKTIDNATDLFGAEGTLFEPGTQEW